MTDPELACDTLLGDGVNTFQAAKCGKKITLASRSNLNIKILLREIHSPMFTVEFTCAFFHTLVEFVNILIPNT